VKLVSGVECAEPVPQRDAPLRNAVNNMAVPRCVGVAGVAGKAGKAENKLSFMEPRLTKRSYSRTKPDIGTISGFQRVPDICYIGSYSAIVVVFGKGTQILPVGPEHGFGRKSPNYSGIQ